MVKRLLFVCLFSLSFSAFADDLLITWDAPTQREDGSAITSAEIAGYEIQHTIDNIAQPFISTTTNSHRVVDIQNGVHVFQVRTIDSAGTVGEYSPPLSQSVSDIVRAAPSTVTITFTVECDADQCTKVIE